MGSDGHDPSSDPTGTVAGLTPTPREGSHAPSRRRSREAPPLYAAGNVLAGRFRIDRFLAQGGMGDVYAAFDLELGETVALKTIRPDLAEDARALTRFRSEIQLARRVTHPNACRIFDLFHDQAEGTDTLFLTMELLPGETLADRLHRDGRLSTEEALPLVMQMAAALAAAHEAGVVHRDFKCANVMLVPTAEGRVRAVVTDFGLARPAGPDVASVTKTEEIVGTPAYMAPEQIEGGPVTPATDVYALGVVLFEMLTGQRPFTGDTAVAALLKRLKEAPSSPRVHVPDLPREWEAVVLRCLARDPAARFAGAAEVAAALRGERVGRSQRSRRRLQAAGALAAVALVLGAWWAQARRVAPAAAPTAPPAASPAAPRRSVAVLGFKNLSRRPEAEWLSTALAEMLGSELGAGERLRTVPGENVARVRAELSIGDVDSLATDTLARARTLLGSDYLVLGSFTALAGQIRLDLRLQDASAGETVATVTETGTEAELFQLVSRTGARLRDKLGVSELAPAQALSARASLPANAEAARLYAEGLGRLRLFDPLAARERFERALARDPAHALTHAALAEAWSELGHDARARDSARRAFELSEALGREERLLVEARYRESTKEWDKAIDIYRALTRFFPDDLEYGLRLAGALEEGGKGREGLAVLAALRALPPPAGRDPRIDITESKVARTVAEHRRAAEAAGRAAAAAAEQGGGHLLAQARFQEGSALQNLGELDRAKAALEEAERMFAGKGDLRGRAGALNNLALVSLNRGDLEHGRLLFEEALGLYRRIGNLSGVALMQGNLGAVHYMRGEVAPALALWEKTLQAYRELNDKQGAARMLTNLASGLADTGHLAPARRRFEEALAAWREVGNKGGEAVTLGDLGRLLFQQGELGTAVTTYEQGIALSRQIGEKAALATMLGGYAEAQAARGDGAGARQHHREALALQDQLGLRPDAALTRLALADLDLREGRAAEAESAARAVMADAEAARNPAGPPTARLALARALAARGRGAEARQQAGEARALAAKAESAALRVSVEVGAATVEGMTDAPAAAVAALARLERLRTEAARLGHVPLQLEARLGAAQVQQRLGQAAAPARLKELATEARSRGFHRLAAAAAAEPAVAAR